MNLTSKMINTMDKMIEMMFSTNAWVAHPCDSRLQQTEIGKGESALRRVRSTLTDGKRGDPRDGVEERGNVPDRIERVQEVQSDARRFQTDNHRGEDELKGGNDGHNGCRPDLSPLLASKRSRVAVHRIHWTLLHCGNAGAAAKE